jgi:hypothetical protein
MRLHIGARDESAHAVRHQDDLVDLDLFQGFVDPLVEIVDGQKRALPPVVWEISHLPGKAV